MNYPIGFVATVFALALGTTIVQAQQPYAGLEVRSIKALSDQQIGHLRAGRGMGLALAAELNGYPGPMHSLELADSMGLSDQQRAKLQDLFAAMKAEAIRLGETLIAQEKELDQQFAEKTITLVRQKAAMEAIGATQAALRETHLKYHLSTANLLTPAQVQRYSELRGYGRVHPPERHDQSKRD